ncbi:MAG: squalene/phytoene synthase family protein, partial [Hyphomicrobiaceae bacterium]|nr:squalene/phytoene synthase family protein [Hyphomicrobiaceae bacterium]
MSDGMETSRLDQAYSYCTDLVRDCDKDRYLASLFAPAARRKHLFALYAFNQEVARIRDLVSSPMPGEMRLQWWRDTLAGIGHGDVQAHPVAAAIIDTVSVCGLPVKPLYDLIEARAFDLYDDPMPTLLDLEGYCGETSSALIQLAALILADGRDPGTAEVSGHGGVAYAITGLLRALPFHAARAQVYVPAEVLSRHGLTPDDVLKREPTAALRAALADLRDLARRHLTMTRALIPTVAPALAPAFLPIALVEPHLDRMDRPTYDPFRTRIEIPQWQRQWILWCQARKARG